MGDLSNRRMKQAFVDSVKDGVVTLPEYAIPNVTVRKGAEDSKMITDTLRDTLTRGLRKAITDNPNDTEKAITQMQDYVRDTFNTYTTSHAKMIAVTEVRSSVDLSKAEYVKELIARNPNRLRVTKKWIHHDHLVKIPRPTHKAIDGEKVLFNQPFSIGLMYPHDPSAPASEVIGCQCGYQVEVEEMATNEIFKELKANINRLGEIRVYKASASINPATGKPYQVGETKVRSDGTKWVKTGTYSWAKAGTKDAEEAKKKTDKDGDGKAEWKEFEGQSSKDAEDIASVYGEKGIHQLTRGGLLNLLHAHGVEDPTKMSWQEKVDKYKEIVKDLLENNKEITIKTEGKEEFTEEDYHILHNSDLFGDASRLENDVIHTRNGDVTLKFTEDGSLTDQCYDELMQKVDPIRGGHWGSAETNNDTALSVALVNAPDWKPIDKMQNGVLAKYDQELTDTMYEHCIVKGIGLRKHAQEMLKHPDMSREKIPNFYRGMTVDASQYEQILAGEVDTIELTGCTAITSFEEVADQYASSEWTKSFGAGRRSVKLIIERDDYMDNSIGMFHHNTKGYAHGNQNIGFELLTGSPSFYIKSVQKGESFNIDKSADNFIRDGMRYDNNTKNAYDMIKDVDISKIYDPNSKWKYDIKDKYGNSIIEGDYYYRVVADMARLKAQSELQDFNKSIADWSRNYYKDHIQDLFSKIKNGRINHANNDAVLKQWEIEITNAWRNSDLYKKWSEIRVDGVDTITDDIDHSELPNEENRKKIDEYYNSKDVIDYFKRYSVLNPVSDMGSSMWRLQNQYDRWKESQDSKKGTLTMKMFLDKQKPLVRSYETQMKKTKNEFDDYENFYKWRNEVMAYSKSVFPKIVDDVRQRFSELTDDDINDMIYRNSDGTIIGLLSIPYDAMRRMSDDKYQEFKDYWDKMRNSVPYYDQDRGLSYGRGYGSSKFDIKDNPFLTDEQKKSPYATYDLNYSDRRYTQLSNIKKNYDRAKNRNEIIQKYDIYNTPSSEIQSKYSKASEDSDNARENLNKYVADKWVESLGLNISDISDDTRKSLYRGSTRYLSDTEKDSYLKYRDNLNNDKEYQKLSKDSTDLSNNMVELSNALSIYQEYSSKLADMHKSSRPLEIHVVCGRGKKSITTGADDQLEEQDNGNN